MSKLPLQLRFQSLNYNLIYNESEGSNLTWKGKQQPLNLNKNYVFFKIVVNTYGFETHVKTR